MEGAGERGGPRSSLIRSDWCLSCNLNPQLDPIFPKRKRWASPPYLHFSLGKEKRRIHYLAVRLSFSASDCQVGGNGDKCSRLLLFQGTLRWPMPTWCISFEEAQWISLMSNFAHLFAQILTRKHLKTSVWDLWLLLCVIKEDCT